METKNLLGTFNSCEVCSKSLKDEGAAEEPLPFLNGVRLLLNAHRIASGFTYRFVITRRVLVQKAKILEEIACEFLTFQI
jgi:hypothetical protein